MELISKDKDGNSIYQKDGKFYKELNDNFFEVYHIMRFANNKVCIEWVDK